MKRTALRLSCCLTALTATVLRLPAAVVTWDNGAATGAWSTAANWDTAEPTAADDVIFPAGLGGTITLAAGENAKSLQFDDDYTLSAGGLTLASASTISVAAGKAATIGMPLTITGGTAKNGTGRLMLGGSNNFTGGIQVNAGTLRIGNANAIGAAANVATVQGGTTLEVATPSFDRPITLNNGGTVAGTGTVSSSGTHTIAAGAVNVTLGTLAAADVLTIGNAANDLTGGSAATVIGISGPGSVRLAQNSNFDGSWNIPAGTRLDLGTATAAGDTPASGITLAGGTLAARPISATSFVASQANALTVTADSTLLSDRSSASTGQTHTFGTLNMGSQLLTIAPGANATSATAAIVLGNVNLSGNPTFAVNDSGVTNGKLTTTALLGGGVARNIIKSGAGDWSLTGGTTDLVSGSAFTATGGGVIELLFPTLGAGASVTPTVAQHPLGAATISVTDGSLRLLADGDGTTAVQTFLFNNPLTLGGTIILDPDRRAGSNTNKTFELAGLTLAAGTTMAMAGDNTYGVRVAGPLTLQGSATLQGSSITSKNGLLTLNGGLTGGAAGDLLTLAGGTSPLVLTLNAPGSFPGSTLVSGATVTANTAAAFGTGATTVSSGSLTVNADAALAGTVTLTGGTLRVNDVDAIAANPVALNGGTLDLRSNATVAYGTGALTLGGNATLNIANNGTGSSQTITLPSIAVSGNRTLTLTNGNSFVPLLSGLALAGDLTLSHTITARSTGISEDGTPRKLLKAGAGELQLEAAGLHSGGTEILAGTLLAEHASALGGGGVTLGDTAGTAAATLNIASGLSVANDLTVRAGSSGLMTIGAVNPANTTLSSGITLQRGVTFNNTNTTNPLTFSGHITGPFDITRSGGGLVTLTNPLNDFGTGGPAALNIAAGTVAVGSDAPLGNGGITIAAAGTLRATGTFSTARLLTLAAGANIQVDATHTLTLLTALAADTAFDKNGEGVLAFGPAVTSTRTAVTTIADGTLRLTGATGLGVASPISMSGSSALDLLNDTSTNYGHPLTLLSGASGAVHVDRAEGGSATGGTHTLGALALGTGNVFLTVTGANGFGLTTGAATTNTSFASVTNNAPGALTFASLGLGGTSGTRTMSFDGSGGDIFITGATAQAGASIYTLTKRGTHTLHLTGGLSIGGALAVNNGTLDLEDNNVALAGAVTLGGLASVIPSVIETGTGTLTLGGDVTYNAAFAPPGAQITGQLDLGAADRRFVVNDSAPAVDLELNGVLSGAAGFIKDNAGTMRLSGTGSNTFTDTATVEQGTLELAKTGGHAIGAGGLTVAAASSATAILLAPDQWPDTTPLGVNAIGNLARLDLNNFTETAASVSMSSTSSAGALLATGATGTLVLGGNLTLANNRNSSGNDAREVLITGTGSAGTAAANGTLDLGGAVRTIAVTTTVVSANTPLCNATIETCITNGGILKTGAQTLVLTNPHNNFTGGLTIAEGCVEFGAAGSPGTGGITLANTGAASACLHLGSTSGVFSHPLTLSGGGSGVAKLIYAGPIGSTLTISGALNLAAQGLCVEVTNGTYDADDGAVLALTGAITDGASAFGLTKTGGGILTLQPGNSFTGLTIQRGVVKVAGDSALGDTAGVLALDGGCFHASGSIILAHDLHFLAGGGTVRVDSPEVLTIPALTWGGAASAFSGSGQVILSGTTVASAAPVLIGTPTAFASVPSSPFYGLGMVLSLRGTSQLPAGNLSLTNNAVLELGSGDFTRAVGIAAGEVQLPTNYGAGWAAHGADRIVNLGGAGTALVWGNNSAAAPFLANAGGSLNSTGDLILGSATATHTVDFQNHLELENGSSFSFKLRDIVVPDGPAVKEAIISGDISMTPAVAGHVAALDLDVEGALEISGNISGPVSVSIYETGTAILSGTNSFTRGIEAGSGGTLIIASDASAGMPDSFYVEDFSHIDAGAMTTPLTLTTTEAYAGVFGTCTGSLILSGYAEGDGLITGSLTVNAGLTGFDGIESYGDEPLRVGGNFTLGAAAPFYAYINGLAPVVEHTQMSVTGTITLAGPFDLYDYAVTSPAPGDTYYIVLNAGADAISGNFDGLPEGATITTGDGIVLTATYTANGDAGATGNDFALFVTFIPPPPSDEVTIVDITQNPATCQVSLTIATDLGQDYIFEVSEDLVTWTTAEAFTGDGTNHTVTSPVSSSPRQFLRVSKDSGGAAAPAP